MKTTTDPIGLYVHIPFCVKKCAYCDFCSFSIREINDKDRYIDALCAEILSYRDRGIKIDSIFFGGGTPSLLSGAEFKRITKAIEDSFEIIPGAEFTVECNPKTLIRENLEDYIRCGVNRISIGLQSIHENELKKLGRIHSFEDFLSTYGMIRESGIKNVSVDLMYGIPEQNAKSFEETLDAVCALSVEHISVYGLIVEEGTYLADHLSDYLLPNEDCECDMYSLACNRLEKAGYSHYEISNYAKPGFRCKHNLKYWNDEEYIGVGVSAYSYYGSSRFGNSRDYKKYVSDFSSCRLTDEIIDNESERYEFAMLSLRLSDGFSLEEYENRFGCDFLSGKEKIVKKLSESGLLRISQGRLMLTEKGFYVSNSILGELL